MRQMAYLRRYLSGFLVLALILTGQAMAMARGKSMPVGYAEYCISQNPVMVPVDAEGNPTDPPQFCPDASLCLFNHVAVTTPGPWAVHGAVSKIGAHHDLGAHVIRPVVATARAPPVLL